MINTYPVKGLLQCVADGTITTHEANTRINEYLKMIEVKAKAEMKLEIINKVYKSHQSLCDIEPESDEKHPVKGLSDKSMGLYQEAIERAEKI